MGWYGVSLWYIYEIAIRAEYYRLLLKDDPLVTFHDVQLDGLSEPAPVAELLEQLGAPRKAQEIILPPPANQSRWKAPLERDQLKELRHVIDTMAFDPAALARAYIDRGRRIGGEVP